MSKAYGGTVLEQGAQQGYPYPIKSRERKAAQTVRPRRSTCPRGDCAESIFASCNHALVWTFEHRLVFLRYFKSPDHQGTLAPRSRLGTRSIMVLRYVVGFLLAGQMPPVRIGETRCSGCALLWVTEMLTLVRSLKRSKKLTAWGSVTGQLGQMGAPHLSRNIYLATIHCLASFSFTMVTLSSRKCDTHLRVLPRFPMQILS